ncbi:MAG: asparaginase [Nocardioidaceae bacterium]|nr:asparaginase [Nocardioidaceae bacterium]
MRRVVVITTGGTIASTSTSSGAKAASVGGADLLAGLSLPADLHVEVVDVVQVNSYDLTFADMDAVHAAVREALAQPDTCGVVVTHGTDTLEETAMLIDLFHAEDRPVVFTGAQRSHDDADNDGPRNLTDAITVAASPEARGRGVLVCFAGVIHAARGTRKVHTNDLAAFLDVDHGPVGRVLRGKNGVLEGDAVRPRASIGLSEPAALAGVRVAIVASYPDADATAIDAYLAAGVDGIVVEATGYGNANAAIIEGVGRCTEAAVPVVVSTRVAGGPVEAVYAGGAALIAAGAVSAGLLRPSQARIQLAALIGAGREAAQIRAAFGAAGTR